MNTTVSPEGPVLMNVGVHLSNLKCYKDLKSTFMVKYVFTKLDVLKR